MEPIGPKDNTPSYPHRVDILIGDDDEIAPARIPTARVEHIVTMSDVRHRFDRPVRVGFGFGLGFFAAQAVFRLCLFLVLLGLLAIFALRALALLGL
jgi:hypothetical protein